MAGTDHSRKSTETPKEPAERERDAFAAMQALAKAGNRIAAVGVIMEAVPHFPESFQPRADFLCLVAECARDTAHHRYDAWAMQRAEAAEGGPADLIRLDILRSGHLLARGEPDRALALARAARDRAEALNEPLMEADAVGRTAAVLTLRGDLAGALRLRKERQLPVYERVGASARTGKTVREIAEILLIQGNFSEARRLLERTVLPIYRRIGEEKGIAEALVPLARIVGHEGQPDRAVHILKKEVLPVFAQSGDIRQEALVEAMIADCTQRFDPEAVSTRQLKENVLPVFERLADPCEQAFTRWIIACGPESYDDYEEEEEEEDAVEKALRIVTDEVLPVLQRLDYPVHVAVMWQSIAALHAQSGRPEESLRLLRREVVPAYRRMGCEFGLAAAKLEMATRLTDMEEPGEALRILEDEVIGPLLEDGHYHLADAAALQVIRIHQANPDLEAASRTKWDRVLAEFRQKRDRPGEVRTLYRMALDRLHSITDETGGLDAALDLAARAYEGAVALKSPDHVSEMGVTYAYLLKRTGDDSRARAVLAAARDAFETLKDPFGLRGAQLRLIGVDDYPEGDEDWAIEALDVEEEWEMYEDDLHEEEEGY